MDWKLTRVETTTAFAKIGHVQEIIRVEPSALPEHTIIGTRTWVVEELRNGDVIQRHEFSNEPEALAKLAELRAALPPPEGRHERPCAR